MTRARSELPALVRTVIRYNLQAKGAVGSDAQANWVPRYSMMYCCCRATDKVASESTDAEAAEPGFVEVTVFHLSNVESFHRGVQPGDGCEQRPSTVQGELSVGGDVVQAPAAGLNVPLIGEAVVKSMLGGVALDWARARSSA